VYDVADRYRGLECHPHFEVRKMHRTGEQATMHPEELDPWLHEASNEKTGSSTVHFSTRRNVLKGFSNGNMLIRFANRRSEVDECWSRLNGRKAAVVPDVVALSLAVSASSHGKRKCSHR
jgi:hypothetical protein